VDLYWGLLYGGGRVCCGTGFVFQYSHNDMPKFAVGFSRAVDLSTWCYLQPCPVVISRKSLIFALLNFMQRRQAGYCRSWSNPVIDSRWKDNDLAVAMASVTQKSLQISSARPVLWRKLQRRSKIQSQASFSARRCPHGYPPPFESSSVGFHCS
jgi:hypothetical protein